MTPKRPAVLFALLTVGLGQSAAIAGPLDPPPGPVAETDVLQREADARIPVSQETTPGDTNAVVVLSQPGSYYLTERLKGQASKHSIEINANDVTLDLNGFDIIGVKGSLDGVRAGVTGLSGIEVRNGVIRGHQLRGINFGAFDPVGSIIRDIHATDNTSDGIISGDGAIVERCVASGNGSDGFRAGVGSTIRDSQAIGNGRDGIEAAQDCVVVGCLARANTLAGINVGDGSTVRDSQASGNGSDGIEADQDCLVVGCLARDNVLSGINAGDGSTVRDCVAHENTEHGISIGRGCRAIGNTCEGNAEHGIDVRAGGNFVRVEGNHCVGNDVGIRSNATDGLYLRNTCGDSTTNNWIIGSGNSLLVVELSTTGGSVVGDSGGASPGGSGNPHANWSH